MTKTKKLTVLLSIILMLVLSIFGVVITSSIPQVAASADEITSENFPDTSTWTKTEYNGEPVGGKILRFEASESVLKSEGAFLGDNVMHWLFFDVENEKATIRFAGTTTIDWEIPSKFGEGFVEVYIPYGNYFVEDYETYYTFYSRTEGASMVGGFFDPYSQADGRKCYILSSGEASTDTPLAEGMSPHSLGATVGGKTFRVYKNEKTWDQNYLTVFFDADFFLSVDNSGRASIANSFETVYHCSVDVNNDEYFEFKIPATTLTYDNDELDVHQEINLAEAKFVMQGENAIKNGLSLYSMVTPTAGDSEDEEQTPTPEEPDEIVLPEGMTEYDFSSPIGGKTFRIYDFKGANIASFNLLQGDYFYFLNINKTTQKVTLDHNGLTTKTWELESTFTEDYVEFKVPAASYSVEWVDAETQETMTDEIDLRVTRVMKSSEADWTLYAMETVTSEPEVPGDEPETPSDDEDKPSIGDWIDNKLDSVSGFLSEYTGYSISAGVIIIAIIVIVLIKKK